MCHDVAAGLSVLRSEHVLHRDLKPANVMVDAHCSIAKLSDFGLAKNLAYEAAMTAKTPGGPTTTTTTTPSAPGTIANMAPELFGLRPKFSEKSDVYALGVLCWEVAARVEPYRECVSADELRRAVREGEREEIPAECAPTLAALIARCWHGAPDNRPTANECAKALK